MSFWKFLWRLLGHLNQHPRTCVCALVCPWARGCGRACERGWLWGHAPAALPPSADPDWGGLERGDVSWNRIARWSQQRHVLVGLLHCPDAVWKLYPSAVWARGSVLPGPALPSLPRRTEPVFGTNERVCGRLSHGGWAVMHPRPGAA